MAAKVIGLCARFGQHSILVANLVFNRLTLQISSLARNGVPEYYLLLAAPETGAARMSLGVDG